MINLKANIESLAITIILLITVGITSGCAVKIIKDEKTMETLTLENDVLKKTLNIKNINAVVIRKNELLSISLNDDDENITLDSGGNFSRPIISPNKNYVAYLKDEVLYITTDKLQHLKVEDNVSELSFTWQDKNNLLYSPTTGGLYVYDVVNKISKPHLENQINYQNITLDSRRSIYAEQYRYYKKNGSKFRDEFGVIFFNPDTNQEKIIIKSIPSKINTGGDLGMYPIITGISQNDTYLYIWKHPHSVSLAADGVNLSVYNTLNNKLIEYTDPNIISLPYRDNTFPNPKNSRFLALIYGGGREMSNNKILGVLDILTGKLQSLSPKGEAAMTPSYKSHGNEILYASSTEQKNVTGGLTQWLLNGKHHIFSVNIITKQLKQLTNNPNYFDFSPKYIDNKTIIFFRSDKTENISIWRYDKGRETMLTDGIAFYNDMNLPLQNYYGHFNTSLFTDIKSK